MPASSNTTPRPDASGSPLDIEVIADQVAFDRLLDSLADEPLLAIDTEAASFHRYEDRVYLLQISSRNRTAVVDPLAVDRLDRFAALLADPRIEVVFHDADYDLRLLERQYGIRAARLFDTRIAAQFLNEPGIGLAALLQKYFGVTLNKKYQRADWSARPLSDEMLAYAATDTHYLAGLRDELRGQLEARGRLSWVEEEFGLLEGVAWAAVEPGESSYLRLKGAKALRGRELALLRALYDWREDTARRLDRASFRILNNEPLFTMSRQPPRSMEELQRVKGVGPETIARRGAEILDAIEQAMSIPERDLPRLPRPPRRAPDPAADARFDRLKAARNLIANRLDLAPGVACPNGTLEEIARQAPTTLEALEAIPSMRRWQRQEFGEELLAAVPEPPAAPAGD
ncbi:MAG: ribonuclease D [Gemmatimonadales bacterium]|nr:MAG: ribonuclease D [Gemmatimonadales bacterium]